MMEDLFYIAMKFLGAEFEGQRELFDRHIEMLEKRSLPGEFDRFGGPRKVAIRNVKIFLDRWTNEETRQSWLKAIPELT